MNILISESAHENISNIAEFTSNISTKYTNKIVSALYSSIDTLEYAPHCGRYVPEIMDKHFREILCNGYRIMYFISEKENFINVLYVLSDRQNRTQFLEVHKKEIFDIINFLNQFIYILIWIYSKPTPCSIGYELYTVILPLFIASSAILLV